MCTYVYCEECLEVVVMTCNCTLKSSRVVVELYGQVDVLKTNGRLFYFFFHVVNKLNNSIVFGTYMELNIYSQNSPFLFRSARIESNS